jgi:formylglycine-generating enzyme required for sulfatase activity
MRQAYKDGQPVDTVGLAAWGKTNSIDFVQLVVEKDCTITIDGVSKSGKEQLAQVVRCGAAQYSGRGYYRTRFVPNRDTNIGLGTEYDEMVYVAGGVFQILGSNYYVQLSDFYIGKYEVTEALWNKVMGVSGGSGKAKDYLSWTAITGANGFLEKLNAQTGKNYRLPTEAEWEYAARGCKAGACDSYTYSGSDDLNAVGWYKSNCSALQVVGQKSANGLGLYDMSGNIHEWCYDWYGSYGSNTLSTPAVNPTGPTSGSYRVLRGGSWAGGASDNRVAYRHYDSSSHSARELGFRLV